MSTNKMATENFKVKIDLQIDLTVEIVVAKCFVNNGLPLPTILTFVSQWTPSFLPY